MVQRFGRVVVDVVVVVLRLVVVVVVGAIVVAAVVVVVVVVDDINVLTFERIDGSAAWSAPPGQSVASQSR